MKGREGGGSVETSSLWTHHIVQSKIFARREKKYKMRDIHRNGCKKYFQE